MPVFHGKLIRGTPRDDTFSAAVEFSLPIGYENGHILKALLRLMDDRCEKEIRSMGGSSLFVRASQKPVLSLSPVVFCTDAGNEFIFVNKPVDWLTVKLLNSAKIAREVRRGIRPIFDVHDLLNTERNVPTHWTHT